MVEREVSRNRTATLAVHLGPDQAPEMGKYNRTATRVVHQTVEMAEQEVRCNRTATLAVHLDPGQALEMAEQEVHNHINKIAELAEVRWLSITILEAERLLNRRFQMLEVGEAR
jgi:hypothetical protein